MTARNIAVVCALFLGGAFVAVAIYLTRKRQNTSKERGVKEQGEDATEASSMMPEDASSDDSLEETFVKIRLHPSSGGGDREFPRAPPPSRNLSRAELPKGDSLEEETGKRMPSTPPPSRSMSSSELSSSVFTINEIEETGPLLAPPGNNKQPSRGIKIITDEVAAAMSLSLAAQGYGDHGDEDTPSFCIISDALKTGSHNDINVAHIAVPQTFSFIPPDASSKDLTSLSSIETLTSSDFSVISEDYDISDTDIRQTMTSMEAGNYSDMTATDAKVLTHLLRSSSIEQQESLLVHIANAAAFTKNQNLLREAGCAGKLTALLRAHEVAMRVSQQVTYPTLVKKVISTVNNLSVNDTNQKELQDCIPALIDFATATNSPESVQLSSLQALTNLSTTSDNHQPYTKVIQQLYEALDQASPAIQQQALKVLVNLSTNPDMVPHLLAAKAPACVLTLLVPTVDENLILRWVTILANVMNTVKEKHITAESLPTDYKAASPETMFTALYGVANSAKFRSKIFVLSKHEHQDISFHAARIYSLV